MMAILSSKGMRGLWVSPAATQRATSLASRCRPMPLKGRRRRWGRGVRRASQRLMDPLQPAAVLAMPPLEGRALRSEPTARRPMRPLRLGLSSRRTRCNSTGHHHGAGRWIRPRVPTIVASWDPALWMDELSRATAPDAYFRRAAAWPHAEAPTP